MIWLLKVTPHYISFFLACALAGTVIYALSTLESSDQQKSILLLKGLPSLIFANRWKYAFIFYYLTDCDCSTDLIG